MALAALRSSLLPPPPAMIRAGGDAVGKIAGYILTEIRGPCESCQSYDALIKALRDESEKLTEELSTARESRARLEADKSSLATCLSLAEEDFEYQKTVLREEVSVLHADLEKLEKIMLMTIQEKAELEKQQGAITSLQEVKAAEEAREEERLIAEVSRLRTENDHLLNSLGTLKQQTKDEVLRLQHELAHALEIKAVLEAQAAKLSDSLLALQAAQALDKAKLTDENGNLLANLNKADMQLLTSHKEKAELQQKIADLEQNMADAERERDNFKVEAERLLAENKNLLACCMTTKTMMEDMKANASAEKDMMKHDFEQQLQRLSDRNSDLIQRSSEQDTAISVMEADNAEKQAKLWEKVRRLQDEIKKVREQLEEARQEKATMDSEFDEMEISLRTMVVGFERERAKFLAGAEKLKEEIKVLKANESIFLRELKAISSDLPFLMKQASKADEVEFELQRVAGSLEAEAMRRKELADSNKKLQEELHHARSTEEDNKFLHLVVKQLEQQVKDYKSDIQQLLATQARMEDEMASLREEISSRDSMDVDEFCHKCCMSFRDKGTLCDYHLKLDDEECAN